MRTETGGSLPSQTNRAPDSLRDITSKINNIEVIEEEIQHQPVLYMHEYMSTHIPTHTYPHITPQRQTVAHIKIRCTLQGVKSATLNAYHTFSL